jgi:hypothetical protein
MGREAAVQLRAVREASHRNLLDLTDSANLFFRREWYRPKSTIFIQVRIASIAPKQNFYVFEEESLT